MPRRDTGSDPDPGRAPHRAAAELPPEAVELAHRMRELVDRSGLSVAAVADSTGYTKASWDAYLWGRLPTPRGAVIALAEALGTGAGELGALWEAAERTGSKGTTDRPRSAGDTDGPRHPRDPDDPPDPGDPVARPAEAADPATTGHESGSRAKAGRGAAGGGAGVPGGGSAPDGSAPRHRTAVLVASALGVALVVLAVVLLTGLGGSDGDGNAAAGVPTTPRPGPSLSASTSAPTQAASAGSSPSPSLPAPSVTPPPGIGCLGDSCTGRNPESMKCAGPRASTVSSATVGGALVEVRYSRACRAAWARVTRAAPGATVRIRPAGGAAPGRPVVANAGPATSTYTPMAAAPSTAGFRACLTLASGAKGCATAR